VEVPLLIRESHRRLRFGWNTDKNEKAGGTKRGTLMLGHAMRRLPAR